MILYEIWLDGGGNAKKPCYFSTRGYKTEGKIRKEMPEMRLNTILLSSMPPEYRPIVRYPSQTPNEKSKFDLAPILNKEKKETNNLAEYVALHTAVKLFGDWAYANLFDVLNPAKETDFQVNFYHDSQFCYRTVLTSLGQVPLLKAQKLERSSTKLFHLRAWNEAVVKEWKTNYRYQWVPREKVVKELGH